MARVSDPGKADQKISPGSLTLVKQIQKYRLGGGVVGKGVDKFGVDFGGYGMVCTTQLQIMVYDGAVTAVSHTLLSK